MKFNTAYMRCRLMQRQGSKALAGKLPVMLGQTLNHKGDVTEQRHFICCFR